MQIKKRIIFKKKNNLLITQYHSKIHPYTFSHPNIIFIAYSIEKK